MGCFRGEIEAENLEEGLGMWTPAELSLDRQVMEKVQIQNFKGPVLMNRRDELGGVRIERTRYRRWGNTQ